MSGVTVTFENELDQTISIYLPLAISHSHFQKVICSFELKGMVFLDCECFVTEWVKFVDANDCLGRWV